MSFDKKLKNNSKKCLTAYHESDKITKLSAAKAAVHRTLKIEQYRKTCKEPFKCLEKHEKQFQK